MPVLLWDASALAKRYIPETGSETVHALFQALPVSQMVATFAGYAEIFSILRRKRNNKAIGERSFRSAVSLMETELFFNRGFGLLSISDGDILAGMQHILDHNLNSSDAAILAALLRYKDSHIPTATSVLVTADKRLLRAGDKEGLLSLNPEEKQPEEIPPFIDHCVFLETQRSGR